MQKVNSFLLRSFLPFSLNVILTSFLVSVTSPSAQACDTGFEAFQATVYQQVRRDCVKCHDGTKPMAPPFAVSDAAASYGLLLNYMNFSKIEESLLLVRAGNGHCGNESCEEDKAIELTARAKQWWESGEKQCFRNGKFFTEELILPETLPTPSTGFLTLSFDLGVVNPSLKGEVFQIDVQNFIEKSESQVGAYRFKSPRFAQGHGSLRFKDIKVLLNGKYDPIYNAFTIEAKTSTIVESTMSSPILSGHSMILLKDELRPPRISISFVEIEPIAEAKCRGAAGFEKNVLPMIKSLNCASCHNEQGSSVGEKTFSMNLSTETLCRVSNELTNVELPMSSALISFPTRGLFNHPKIDDSKNSAYVKTIKQWIQNFSKESP